MLAAHSLEVSYNSVRRLLYFQNVNSCEAVLGIIIQQQAIVCPKVLGIKGNIRFGHPCVSCHDGSNWLAEWKVIQYT